MCLLITAMEAIIATVVWYVKIANNLNKIGTLCRIYWGASLMRLVDAFFCLAKGEPFFNLSLNDALIGYTLAFCWLAAWIVIILLKGLKRGWFYKYTSSRSI